MCVTLRGSGRSGVRMVNWCPALRTAISDVEVEHVTLAGKSTRAVPGRAAPVHVGVIETFRYPLEGGGAIAVSTAARARRARASVLWRELIAFVCV